MKNQAKQKAALTRWETHRAKMREFERLKKEAEQHQANLDHWKKKVEIANKIADDFENENTKLKNNLRYWKKKNERSKVVCSELAENNYVAEKKLYETEKKLENVKYDLAKLQSEIEEKDTHIKNLQAKNYNLNSKCEAISNSEYNNRKLFNSSFLDVFFQENYLGHNDFETFSKSFGVWPNAKEQIEHFNLKVSYLIKLIKEEQSANVNLANQISNLLRERKTIEMNFDVSKKLNTEKAKEVLILNKSLFAAQTENKRLKVGVIFLLSVITALSAYIGVRWFI